MWHEHWAELTALTMIAFQAGGSVFMLRGIREHLGRVNGRLDRHGDEISTLKQSDAQLRGALGISRG
jgi:hypothetical protein